MRDVDAEADNGSPAIRTIFSRWIPAGGLTAAQRVCQILLGRYVVAPREFKFEVYRYGEQTPTLGEGARLFGAPMQIIASAEDVPIQIMPVARAMRRPVGHGRRNADSNAARRGRRPAT